MTIRKAIQIGDNVTDIMKLPCVVACIKKDDQNGFWWLEYRVKCGASGRAKYAEKYDWLVEDENALWNVMSDDEYKQTKRLKHERTIRQRPRVYGQEERQDGKVRHGREGDVRKGAEGELMAAAAG